MGIMDAPLNRRLSVAVSWALARRATLDAQEHYEESYALTEEFREWLMGLDEHPQLVEMSMLFVPTHLYKDMKPETDGLLEI